MNLIEIAAFTEGRGVAQNCILPYRGCAVRKACQLRTLRIGWRSAECNSAIQQNAILRYVGRRL
jgi:hypothetical protein